MAKFVPTSSTLEQAIELTAAGKFPYYHPCCACNKACSMPTRPLWDKRVSAFGSIEAVYASYTCRDCKKGDKPVKVPFDIAKAPRAEEQVETTILPQAEEPVASPPPHDVYRAPRRADPIPGQPVKPIPGKVGMSEWVDGRYVGTTWYSLGLQS
jgi:hypothetical protein